MRRGLVGATVFATVVLAALTVQAQTAVDTIFIVKDDNISPTNVEVALALAGQTPFPDGRRVIVSRDDQFADALASGVLQDGAPLLLVPSAGPLPQGVIDQIGRLGAQEAIVLGGTAAVGESVVSELAGLGLSTTRRAGQSRFETAVDVARTDAPSADTLLLARAFPAEGSTDPSQAFADTLAAGGLAARNGWPIVLTQTDVLSAPTRDYIIQARPARVLILGGTAAISQAVADEVAALGPVVQRVSGASRAETAVEVARVDGTESASDVSRVVLVEGQGDNAWAGGFAAASHAAAFDAPILLATGGVLPAATEAFLAPGIGGDPEAAPVLTCVVVPDLCETARVAADLPPMSPDPGQTMSQTFAVELGIGEESTVEFDAGARVIVSAEAAAVPEGCGGLNGTIRTDGGSSQTPVFLSPTTTYWPPLVAMTTGGWSVDLRCVNQSEPVTVVLDVTTTAISDAAVVAVGEEVEETRDRPSDVTLARVDLGADEDHLVRQTIAEEGATAAVLLLGPDDEQVFGNPLTCASGSCVAAFRAPATGTYLIVAGSYGDGPLRYTVVIDP